MNIKKVLIIYIVTIFISSSFCVYGTQINNTINEEVDIYSEETDKIIEEETYKCINSLITEIAKELRQIDGKASDP